MTDLRYEAPSTLDVATALLAGAKGTARILAGGTDVIVQMQTDAIAPELIVDIKKFPSYVRSRSDPPGSRSAPP